MEKDTIPAAPICANRRSLWKRSLLELNGRPGRSYIRQVSPLLLQSYAEIGAFPHMHNISESPCTTYTRLLDSSDALHRLYSGSASDYTNLTQAFDRTAFYLLQVSLFRVGVSALEFNTKGTCLASVTRSGCLTLHEFESLCNSNESADQGDDEKKRPQHFSLSDRINAVRWNPSNQDEDPYYFFCLSIYHSTKIAYASLREVSIFDIVYNSSQPAEVLRRHAVSTYPQPFLSDTAFLNGGTRFEKILASDSCGVINMWDRRVSDLPQIGFTTSHNNSAPCSVTSIQLPGDQYIYGACKNGSVNIWDLRGGRSLASNNEVYSSPLTSVNLTSMLNNTGLLKEIHSINVNPSCPYQLGFHLQDGRSCVLDMHNFEVSHIHCPPPSPWLDGRNTAIHEFPRRKPSWLPNHWIYVVPSTSSNGLHLLDFYPHRSSLCHVEYDDSKSMRTSTVERKQSAFVPLSKRVTACVNHPLNDTIVAGTMEASLLVISQKHLCKRGDDDDYHS